MTILLDADYILYKAAAGCESEVDFGDDLIVVSSRFSDLQRTLEWEFTKIENVLGEQEIILFFSDSKNFRKDILPDYKGHRNRKKPCGYRRAIDWLTESFSVIRMPTLEADDALGIHATDSKGFDYPIIVSPDKDMRQIPGHLWDLTSDDTVTITEEEGRQWHLIQSLAGDQTDGYPGCPGIGVKRAVALFEKTGYNWETVVAAFEKADQTEEDALRNARLAKILTYDFYNFDTSEPILWTPDNA